MHLSLTAKQEPGGGGVADLQNVLQQRSAATHVFELLYKLANLLNHLGHKDDVHLVGEVGRIDGADQQATSPLHHVALVQRHLEG